MTRFATTLQTWMDTEQPDLSGRHLSEMCGIPSSDFSRIRAGDKLITYKALSKMLPVIKQQWGPAPACRLLRSYLEDEIPEGFTDDVKITISSEPNNNPSDLFSQALIRAKARGEKDPDYAYWFVLLDLMTTESNADTIQTLLSEYRSQREAKNLVKFPQPTGDEILSRVAEDSMSIEDGPADMERLAARHSIHVTYPRAARPNGAPAEQTGQPSDLANGTPPSP